MSLRLVNTRYWSGHFGPLTFNLKFRPGSNWIKSKSALFWSGLGQRLWKSSNFRQHLNAAGVLPVESGRTWRRADSEPRSEVSWRSSRGSRSRAVQSVFGANPLLFSSTPAAMAPSLSSWRDVTPSDAPLTVEEGKRREGGGKEEEGASLSVFNYQVK